MTEPRPHSSSPALLETKLHAPRPRRGLVERPRLTSRLDDEGLPALTVISAPAGFGKTTLLADWLAQPQSGQRAVAWVSLDERDSDPARFWTYLVTSLRSSGIDAGATALTLLAEIQPLEAVVSSLLNDLSSIVGEAVIVLDDYHAIDSPELHEAVGFMVEHLPGQARLVLASRADPPLPLGRLRARGDLVEVRAADLRFTEAETDAYLNGSMGLALAADDIGTLGSRTEGWIAALQLAALSLQDRDDRAAFIASFAGDDRFVVDFLAEEVLERQSDDVRSFLLDTAVLDRFTGSLCDAVTCRSDGRAMLEQLDRSNLFLVALDGRRAWYRYHHLFADVLRARLTDEQPARVAAIHRRAAAWYETNNDPVEAIGHAIAGHDHDTAARLLEMAAPQLRQARQEATLLAWLDALPDQVFTNRPVLAMALIGARVATHDPAGVDTLLEAVEGALEPGAAPPIVVDPEQFARLPAQLLVHRAGVEMLRGNFSATIPLATEVLELAEPDDDLERGIAHGLLGLGHWAAGDLEAAERHYAESVRSFTAADHLPDALGCSLAMADIQIALGKLGAAARTFEAGLRWTAERPGLRGAADMHIGLSEVLIERNDLDAATAHLDTSLELGDTAGLPQHAYRWRVTTARLCRARGDLDAALELIEEAVPLYETDFSPPVRPVAALRTRVLLARGDLNGAQSWVAEQQLAPADELSYVAEFSHITLSRVLIASADPGSLDEAISLLSRLLIAAEAGSRTGSVIEILILQATALLAQGDHGAAVDALGGALARSEPEGHIRLFLHAGPAVAALLRDLATGPHATPHVRRVLAAADAAVQSSQAAAITSPILVDELSARELDVLRLLRSDLGGPDIARELHVSLNTLRSHTKNIYVKLGVNNRREAVTRADELGL